MTSWTTQIRVTRETIRLRVWDATGNDLVRAALPRSPHHPRAVLTLLEGLALWAGEVLCVATSVDSSAGPSPDVWDGWPFASVLVRFEFPPPLGRRHRLRLKRAHRGLVEVGR
jgi:hypothetical protein